MSDFGPILVLKKHSRIQTYVEGICDLGTLSELVHTQEIVVAILIVRQREYSLNTNPSTNPPVDLERPEDLFRVRRVVLEGLEDCTRVDGRE